MKLKYILGICIILLTLVACEPEETKPLPNNLSVHFLDMGQGDATLIVFPNNKTLLIDCGNNITEPFLNITRDGEEIIFENHRVVEYVKKIGLKEINVLITTHPDANNIGGCAEIMRNMVVRYIIDNNQTKDTKTYKTYRHYSRQPPHTDFIKKKWTINVTEDAVIAIMAPYNYVPKEFNNDYNEDYNDNSLIVQLNYGKIKMLFMGGCSKECEEDIYPMLEKVDLLKVGNHGSKTSSSEFFLNKIKPKLCIISTGLNNRFGYPHSELLERLFLKRCVIYGTYNEGDMVFETNGVEIWKKNK